MPRSPSPTASLAVSPRVDGWRLDGAAGYLLTVSDPAVAAPAVTRALVAAGADVLSIAESQHSLEDVYLELIDEDVEAGPRRVSRRRIRAIFRKELREYRRNRSIVVADGDLPADLPAPAARPVFTAARVVVGRARAGVTSLLYMLAHPGAHAGDARRLRRGRRAPAGHARAGAHDADPARGIPAGQGAGGPRPVARDRLRGLRVLPRLHRAFAQPAVAAAAVLQRPDMLAQVLFTPLLAAWSIWVGIAISTRSSDVRVAQQLGLLASLPPVVVTSLIAFDVIHATLGLALGLAALLVLADALGWRVVSPMFDRERLITGR